MLASLIQNNQNVTPTPKPPAPSVINQGPVLGGASEPDPYEEVFVDASVVVMTAPVAASLSTAPVTATVRTAPVSAEVTTEEDEERKR